MQISAPYFEKCAQAKLLLRWYKWGGGKDCLVRVACCFVENKLKTDISYSAAMTNEVVNVP